MCHVVDEVVFHVGQLLLAEDQVDCYDKHHQQHKRHDKRRNDIVERRHDVITLGGEVDLEVIHQIARIVGKKRLHKHIVITHLLRHVASRMIHRGTLTVDDSEFKRQVKAVVGQFHSEICGHLTRICAFGDRTCARLAYHAQYHLVHKRARLKILFLQYLMGRPLALTRSKSYSRIERIEIALQRQCSLLAFRSGERILYATLLAR